MWARRARTAEDFTDEIRAHIALETDRLVGEGMSPDEARRTAYTRFGSVTATTERFYESRRLIWLDDLWRDGLHGVQSLRGTPGFAVVAVLTLALGIGINTAVFSLVDALLLRDLHVPAAHELVRYRFVAERGMPGLGLPGTYTPDFGLSGPMFDSLRKHQSASTDVFAWAGAEGLTLSANGESRLVRANWASGSAFRVLGVRSYRGRVFEETDDRPSGGPDGAVGVISYGFWRDAWNGDESIVGRTLVINRTPVKIVGILPADFSGVHVGVDPQIILPFELEPALMRNFSQRGSVGAMWVDVMGRLKPGLTLQRAQADLDVIRSSLSDEAVPLSVRNEVWSHFRLEVISGRTGGGGFVYRNEYRLPLVMVQALVGILLLVVCANLSGLLLARSGARRRELEVRHALGAGRWRLVRQLTSENLLLAATAVPIGCLMAWWTDRAALGFLSHPDTPLHLDVTPNATVLLVTISCAVVIVVLAGTIPALVVTRSIRAESLGSGPRITDPSRRGLGGRYLMPAQIALSMTLVGIAALCTTSVIRLLTTSSGMNAGAVILARTNLDMRPERGAQMTALYERMLEELSTKPAVRSVTAVAVAPMTQGDFLDVRVISHMSDRSVREDPHVYVNFIGPRFFETFGIRELVGRDFQSTDAAGAVSVCILNRSAANYFFPNTSAIGQHLEAHWTATGQPASYEVVGVVENAKYTTLHQDPPRTLYRPYTQAGERQTRLTLAIAGPDSRALVAAYRATLHGIAPDTPLFEPVSLRAQMVSSVAMERAAADLTMFLGAISLLLTCISLFGHVAWNVTRRTAEIGVRLALGAAPGAILRLAMRDVSVALGCGTLVGVIGMAAAARLVASVLYNTKPLDPLLILSAIICVSTSGLVAAYFAARRATKVDPLIALRCE